jgi:preprotein translocase subunit SecF
MSRAGNLGGRLYRGEVSYDFVGRQKRWYLISAVVILVAVVALFVRGLHFSIDFRGGNEYTVKSATLSTDKASSTVTGLGVTGVSVTEEKLLSGGRQLLVETPPISTEKSVAVANALAKDANIDPGQIGVQAIGGNWGSQISQQAVKGLIIFMVLVVLYLTLFFEWKMAVAALAALIHDLVITIGVYALVGFQVSPATVVGVLTILGYSLYDTVVVFDKVRENTRSLTTVGTQTYSEAANKAVNQTLVRSINTSLIALLPVLALLFAGYELNGAGVVQDLALALFVGIASGTYSSIFIATPLLADLKERESGMKALARKLSNKREQQAKAGAKGGRPAETAGVPAPAAASDTAAAGDDEIDDTDDVDAEGEVIGAGAGAGRDLGARRGPRAQPVRGKSKNRPSGKRKR